MKYEMMKRMAEVVKMPEEMKDRIAKNCRKQISEYGKDYTMNKKRNIHFGKPAAAVAALAICFSLLVTALAASGATDGFFKDVKNFFGAVTGTSYEQATDEIYVSSEMKKNELSISVSFADPQKAPYKYLEKMGIGAYRIVDEDGAVVKEGKAEALDIVDGRTVFEISPEQLEKGAYTLIISSFVGESKADQPLPIKGEWELSFTK